MSRLSKFVGSPTSMEIPNVGNINIYPITPKDLIIAQKAMYDESVSEEERLSAGYNLIRKSLQEEKDLTDDELNNVPLTLIQMLLEKIADVSGLNDDKRNNALDRIRKAQTSAISK